MAETKDELPVAAKARSYFCNKCGYFGESGPSHTRPTDSNLCDYLAPGDGPYYSEEQMAAAQSRINALLELYEAVSVHLGSADCDCPYRKREAGEHLSHCHLSDLNYAFERASPSAGRGEVSNG